MTRAHQAPFPEWLDRVRRADSKRWAKMSSEEVIADIHRGAQEALRRASEWEAKHLPARPARHRRAAAPS